MTEEKPPIWLWVMRHTETYKRAKAAKPNAPESELIKVCRAKNKERFKNTKRGKE